MAPRDGRAICSTDPAFECVLPANSSFYIGPVDGDEPVGSLELMSRMAGCMSLSGHIANWSEAQSLWCDAIWVGTGLFGIEGCAEET